LRPYLSETLLAAARQGTSFITCPGPSYGKVAADDDKSAYYHIHKIGLIRKFLTVDATKSIVHAVVTSRLDGLNSLLVGLPAGTIGKLPLLG
jgi:hypothetical protein